MAVPREGGPARRRSPLASPGQTFDLYGVTFRWCDAGDACEEESGSLPLVRESGPFPAEQVTWLWRGDRSDPWFGRLGDRYAWRFEGVADCLLPPDGRRLHLFVAPEADSGAVDFILCRGVIPRLLHLRGTPCLHASAVQVGPAVVGFVGPSGSGKSTLAAALTTAGFPLVTDDVLPLRLTSDGSQVVCGPGLTELRLYARAADRIGVGANLMAPGRGQTKGRWLPGADQVALEPLPLQALYLLRPYHCSSERTSGARLGRALRPTEAFVALVENSFWLHAGETRALASDMACFGPVACSIPIRPLYADLSPAGFAAVERKVRRFLEGCGV
jgi:hypothetical protein